MLVIVALMAASAVWIGLRLRDGLPIIPQLGKAASPAQYINVSCWQHYYDNVTPGVVWPDVGIVWDGGRCLRYLPQNGAVHYSCPGKTDPTYGCQENPEYITGLTYGQWYCFKDNYCGMQQIDARSISNPNDNCFMSVVDTETCNNVTPNPTTPPVVTTPPVTNPPGETPPVTTPPATGGPCGSTCNSNSDCTDADNSCVTGGEGYKVCSNNYCISHPAVCGYINGAGCNPVPTGTVTPTPTGSVCPTQPVCTGGNLIVGDPQPPSQCPVYTCVTPTPVTDISVEKIGADVCSADKTSSTVTYTVTVKNNSDEEVIVDVVDTLDPDIVAFITENSIKGGGILNKTTGQIVWNDLTVPGGDTIVLTYAAVIPMASYNDKYTNIVVVKDQTGKELGRDTFEITPNCTALPKTALISDSVDRMMLGILLIIVGVLAYRLNLQDKAWSLFKSAGGKYLVANFDEEERKKLTDRKREKLEKNLKKKLD